MDDTADRDVLTHSELARIAARYGRSVSQVMFRFALDAGRIPLTGKSQSEHMQADLRVFEFQLETADIERIENLIAK